MIAQQSVPFAYNSVDWARMVADYQPAPMFFAGRYLASADEIRALQESRLAACLAHAAATPFYAERWRAAGFDHRAVRTLDDLRQAPVYLVDDIRRDLEQSPPFGTYQAVDLRNVREPVRLHTSGGTTGRPRPTLYTYWDRNVGAILRARSFYLAGFRPGDLVQNTLLYATHNGAFIVDEALYHWLGCVPVTTSAGVVTRSNRQIEIMKEWGVTGIVGYTDYLLHLAETAREMGRDPAADLPLRNISSMGGRARELEAAWGANVIECYGMHEVQVIASECPAKDGMHVWLDAFVIDIVDIDTGAPVPDGEPGSLVLTALYKTGVPVVRYDTRDVTRILSRDRCACGSSLPRLDYLHGRADTMVKLRGVNVWPEACGDIARQDPRLNGEFFCIVERVEGRDEMTMLVERRAATADDDAAIVSALARRLRDELNVSIRVEARPPGSLAEWTGFGKEFKPRRFADRRPKQTTPR